MCTLSLYIRLSTRKQEVRVFKNFHPEERFEKMRFR